MNISRCFSGTAAALLLVALAACGGGGGGGGDGPGGGSASTPLQYSGNSSAAIVTTTNAGTLTANALGGSEVAGTTSSIAGASAAGEGQGQIDIGRRLVRSVRAAAGTPRRTDVRLTAIPVDETEACQSGGTVRTFGDVSPSGTGTVNVTYSNCTVDGESLTGSATMRIDSYALALLIPLDFTISFARLAMRGTSNVDISGSIRVQVDLGPQSETITENVIALSNTTGRMTKSENLVFIDAYNNMVSPSSYSESITGRVYDSVQGFVDIITVNALVFPTMSQPFPSSGELVLTGAANARIRATANSATLLVLALDLDNNGAFETQARLNWADLAGAVGANLADTDGDGMHDSWESAFGLNPNANDNTEDPDSDGFNNLAEYQAGTRPNVADATLPPTPNPGPLPPGPVTGQQVVLANNSDIVYDAVTQRIYAAVRTNPGSVVPINPLDGALGTPIVVGRNPVKLALSADGQFLYVGFEAAVGGASEVQRINLTTQAVDLTIPLGNSQFNGPQFAEDIQVLPGSSTSIAVSLRNFGFSPRHEGVAIYDGATRRMTKTPGHTGSNVIEFSASADTLYGHNNETTEFGFRRLAVTANGVTEIDVETSFNLPELFSGFNADIRFGGGFIFTTEGRMIDPIARTVLRTFALPSPFGNLVVPEPALNRVFYQSGNTIRAFDTGSGTEVGNATVAAATGNPGSLIRWGAKGLAFRTSDGQIFVVQSTSWIP
jgi:hypothetical protein